jgi:hypothetical protein
VFISSEIIGIPSMRIKEKVNIGGIKRNIKNKVNIIVEIPIVFLQRIRLLSFEFSKIQYYL